MLHSRKKTLETKKMVGPGGDLELHLPGGAAAASITRYDRLPVRAAFVGYRAGKRVRGEASRIACPTLVLRGRPDLVCRPENARWLAEHVVAKDVTVRVYANSGHVMAAD